MWALELRVFGALAGGITLLAPDGAVSPLSLASGTLAGLTALATLLFMAFTPWVLHFKLNAAGVVAATGRQIGRVADAAAVVATGGAAVTVRGAAAYGLRARAGQGHAGTSGRGGGAV